MATFGQQVRESMVAGEALEQFRFVKMDTTDNTVVYSDNGELAIGVTQTDAADGDAVTICTSGRTLVEVGAGALTAGEDVGAADDGIAVNAAGTDIILGYCVEGGPASGIATIDFFRGGNAHS